MILNEGKVYIRYIKNKGRKDEKILEFEKKPMLLQLAPYPKNSERIIRAIFKGIAPSWLSELYKEYSIIRTTGNYGSGFAIVAKQDAALSNILMSPMIKGQLNELLDDAHFSNPLERDRLKDLLQIHFETVEKNIKYYPELLEEFDIYYRNESIAAATATMYRGPQWKEHNEENEAKWNALFEMLLTVRDYPEEIEEIVEDEGNQDVEESDEILETEASTTVELEEVLENEEIQEIEEISELEELEEIQEIQEIEELDVVEEIQEIQEIEELEVVEEIQEIQEISIEATKTDEKEPENIVSIEQEFEVVKASNKREKVLAGQILLF